MIRAEQKIRDTSESTLEGDGWGDGLGKPREGVGVDGSAVWAGETERADGLNAEAGSRMGLVKEIYEDGSDNRARGGLQTSHDEGTAPGADGPREVNQSLARLEMNSLEVKLYLDSIDKRISRMEPRLEGMRGAEQELEQTQGRGVEDRSAAPAVRELEQRVIPSETQPETQPAVPTSERRRRAQGVPVERRRPPHAVPGEFEQEEAWSWDWKPVAERWKPWSARWPRAAEQAKVWMRGRRLWAPAVLLGLAAVLGLAIWGLAIWGAGGHGRPGSHSGSRPESQSRAGGPGALTAATAANGGQKISADVPWGPAGSGSSSSRGISPELSNRAGDGGSGRISVEQGVAAPMAGMAAPGSGMATPRGLTPTGAAGGAVVASAGNPAAANPVAAGPAAAGPVNGTNSMTGDAVRTRDGASAAGGSGLDADSSDANVSGTGSSKPTVSGKIVPPAATRVHVSSGVMAGSLVYSPPPKYPGGFAGIFHTQGRVVLQAIISKSGRVEDLRVISGHYMLRGAAKEAVRTWRYRPYHVKGSPVEVATIVSVEFQR